MSKSAWAPLGRAAANQRVHVHHETNQHLKQVVQNVERDARTFTSLSVHGSSPASVAPTLVSRSNSRAFHISTPSRQGGTSYNPDNVVPEYYRRLSKLKPGTQEQETTSEDHVAASDAELEQEALKESHRRELARTKRKMAVTQAEHDLGNERADIRFDVEGNRIRGVKPFVPKEGAGGVMEHLYLTPQIKDINNARIRHARKVPVEHVTYDSEGKVISRVHPSGFVVPSIDTDENVSVSSQTEVHHAFVASPGDGELPKPPLGKEDAVIVEKQSA